MVFRRELSTYIGQSYALYVGVDIPYHLVALSAGEDSDIYVTFDDWFIFHIRLHLYSL